ncbi:Zinc finger, BED-type predicted [Plasmopara halstedii]|uniref:Zinc finger, BED-type predicted n=1 Tax=Plasmopara halstedii TaxID=4781 RepID=A0A0P1AQC5_PLAHL|nr:Zinc finger, BED-type predicted [Plasmopara halstedii]CEG43028.1 Zinc finger, BED-type predicted [Plasmopara halstedii]|eukprot:XP_024579397.1 Zinc finger, BED-type predicted [Plasmopara halstedii]
MATERLNRAQSDTLLASEVIDDTSAARMETVVSSPTGHEDAIDASTGEALFELSSYTGGAPLPPMVNSDMELAVSSTTNASHDLFDHDSIDKSSIGEEKKMGRPSHPAWQYFTRGEKRNRFHYNAYCKFCHENGVKSVVVRGVSGNMIRHLQECMYCPAEVVTQLKLLCAQKDAANFNKRHQTQNRGANMSLQGSLPASKKARYIANPEGSMRDSMATAAKVSVIQDTSASEDSMPFQPPLTSSSMNGELTTVTSSSNSLSFNDDHSSLGNEEIFAKSRLGNVTKNPDEYFACQADDANDHHLSQEVYSTGNFNQLVASSTLLTGLPWDWVWTEQSASIFGENYSRLQLPSAEVLSAMVNVSREEQIIKMRGEKVGVTLAVSWFAASFPKSSFVLLSLVNALGEATTWELIEMGIGDIAPGTVADKIKCNLVDLRKSGIWVINIVTDTSLTYEASRLAVTSYNQTLAIPVIPCFSHTLQMLLGVVLTGSDSSMQTFGKVVDIVQMFSSNRVLNVLRRECGDLDAVLHGPTSHNWYSFIESINSVRQYGDMIKMISSKVVQASLDLRNSAHGSLRKTVAKNLRKDSAGNSIDELAECRLSGAVLQSIQNEEFWESIGALSELITPIKETYKIMSSTPTTPFYLSDVLYQFGRMHQQYKLILSDWESRSSGGRSVEQVRCLLRTLDDMWRLYDQSLMFLGYTFDFRLQSRYLARHQSSLQWLSIGRSAKQYFRDWFCAMSPTQNLSRLRALSDEAVGHFMEDLLAFKERKHPFDSEMLREYDNPKYFYMLVSDSHPILHMFCSRLFSIVTSTPFLGDVIPGKCFLPSTSFARCSQHTLLPLLQMKLLSQTTLRLSKDLFESIHGRKSNHVTANLEGDDPHSHFTEFTSEEARSSLFQSSDSAEQTPTNEADDDTFSQSRIWSMNQWEVIAREWNAHWKREIESCKQLYSSGALNLTSTNLTLDQIFVEALPSRVPHDQEDAVVDV